MAIDEKSPEILEADNKDLEDSDGAPELLVPEMESLLRFAEGLQDKIEWRATILMVAWPALVAIVAGLTIIGLFIFLPHLLSDWYNDEIQNVFRRYFLWPLLLILFLGVVVYLLFWVLVSRFFFELLKNRDIRAVNRIINTLRGLLPAVADEPHMTMLKRTGIESRLSRFGIGPDDPSRPK